MSAPLADLADNPCDESGNYTAQQQLIFKVISDVLDAAQAQVAMQKWLKYADQGSVFSGINAYAREICTQFDCMHKQRALVQALNRALLNRHAAAETQPTKPPAPSIDQNKRIRVARPEMAPSGTTSAVTPELQTFQLLMWELLHLIENNRAGLRAKALQFLDEIIQHMAWSELQQQQMSSLLTSRITQQSRTYRSDELKSLMQYFRDWMDEEIGLEVAGNLVKQAARDVDKTASGMRYSPDNFL